MKNAALKKLGALVLSVMVLASCGKTDDSQVDSATKKTAEITRLSHSGWVGNFAVSSQGAYTIEQVRPGSYNLFYVDAATQQETYLCAVPNCTHDSASCTSYISMDQAPFGCSLFFYQDYLYVIQGSTTDSSHPYLMRMNPDGTDRKIVAELNNGEDFTDCIFGYGDSILCEIGKTDAEGNYHRQMETIDLQTGEREVLFSYPESERESYSLMGGFGSKLVYLHINESGYQYFTVDLSSDNPSMEDWSNHTLGSQFDNETQYCNIQGDYFCTYDTHTNELGYENLVTGESKKFQAPELEPGDVLYGLVYLYDDKFALTLDDAEKKSVNALIDCETGELTGVRYISTRENNNTITGDIGDSLFYLIRYDEKPMKKQEEYNLVGEVAVCGIYGIVSKEDYWNGKLGNEIAFPE